MFITHDMSCSRSSRQRKGDASRKKIEEGSTINIFENPKHSYTKALLGAVPKLEV